MLLLMGRHPGMLIPDDVDASDYEVSGILFRGIKIFQYCTCPAGRVTYNFHSSCKHMYLSCKSVSNKGLKGVICNMT